MTLTRTTLRCGTAVRRRLAMTTALGATLFIAAPVWGQTATDLGIATPGSFSGGSTPGQAVITDGANGGAGATVTLNANNSVVNWTTLNIAADQRLQFDNAVSATNRVAVLNRVAADTTTIAGSISTGGLGGGVQVWISNPNGIIFNQASGQSINTQGFVASALPIGDADFTDGGALRLGNAVSPLSLAQITGSATITTNGGALAIVAPVIRLSGGSYDAGAGDVGFVTASDITIAAPSSPLAMTINAGTVVGRGTDNDASLSVAGAVNGNRALFVLSAQQLTNALLSLPSGASTAATTNGVVVLAGGANVAGSGIAYGGAAARGRGDIAIAGELQADGSIAIVGQDLVNVAGAIEAGGAIELTSIDRSASITGALTAAGTIAISAGDVATVGGDVRSNGGGYAVQGNAVVLGTAGETRTQQAVGAVTIDALAGTVTSAGALSLIGDLDDSGDLMAIGGSGSTGLALTGSTLQSGTGGASPIRFTTSATGDAFAIGTVVAGTIQGAIGAGAASSTITRTGTVAFGDLTLNGTTATTIDAGGSIDQLDFGNVTNAGALTLLAGGAGIRFIDWSGAGAKTADATGLIQGVAIDGGAISLAGMGSKSITSGIGRSTAAASLSVVGTIVSIGTSGAADPRAIVVTGPVTLGTGADPLIGLTVNGTSGAGTIGVVAASATMGALDATGTVSVETSNSLSVGAVAAGSTVTLRANTDNGTVGDARFASISAGGNVAVAGVGVGGASSDAGQSDIRSANGSVSVGYLGSAPSSGRTRLGEVQAATGIAISTGAFDTASRAASIAGDVSLTATAGAVLSSGGSAGAGDFLVSATGGDATVSGAVTALGTYSVSGNNVVLGGAGAVTQAAQTVSIIATAPAGTITGRPGLTVASSGAGAGSLTLGSATTGAIAFTGATLSAGAGAGNLLVRTADAASGLALGTVRAGTISQAIGAGGATEGLARTGTIGFDALTLTGTGNVIGTTGALAVTGPTILAGNGDKTLVLRGDASLTTGGVTLDGPGTKAATLLGASGVSAGLISEVGGAVGTATIDATGGAGNGTATVVGTSLSGTLAINAGSGGAVLGALAGGGAKTVATTGAIGGAGAAGAGLTIAGDGPITLVAGTASPIIVDAITGTPSSLTINGGSLATLRGAVTVTGATSIGQAATGSITGAVDISGLLVTGSLASRTGNGQLFGGVTTAAGAGGTIAAVSIGSGLIDFAGPLNGGGALTTDTSGMTRFRGTVGATTPFGSIETLGTGGIAIDGGIVRTVGAQRYGARVTLGAATVLTGTDGIFTGGVDGGAFNDLTLTFSGNSALAADPFTSIGNLVVDGGGSTTLNGDVTTRGLQRWADTIVLNGAATLASTDGGAITLSGLSGAQSLTVNTAGTTVFGAGAAGLASITTDAGGTTELNGTLSTSGTQTFADAVMLGSGTTVTSGQTAGDAVIFAATVDGAQALTVTAAGRTIFGGRVGSTTRLATLTVDGGGDTVVNGGSLGTSGIQTYGDRLVLGANTALVGSAGSFTNGVAGNGFDLTLDFGQPVAIGDTVGGIGNLDVVGAANLSGVINTSGGQLYRGAVTLDGATRLQSSGGTGTGAIRFLGAVNGTRDLTITTGGTTTFGGVVGSVAPLASLEVTGTGGVIFSAGIPSGGSSVSTTGLQRYAGPAILGADTRLLTAGGPIIFGSTIDGPHTLSLATAGTGTVDLGGQVGGATALTGLSIAAESARFGASGNRVGTIAAAIRGGGLSYDDASALSVGSVGGISGVSTTGSVTLGARGLLSLTQTIIGAAALTGSGVTQTAGAAIEAGAGTIAIDGNDGAVQLAGSLRTTNASVNAVRIVDASSVTLGTVAAGVGTVSIGGVGGDAIAGAVDQYAGGTITAATLSGNAGGAVTLTNAGNAIRTLGAVTANRFALRNGGDLVVAGPIDAGSGDLTLTLAAGTLTLDGLLSAGNGTVSLITAGGSITQSTTAGGGIVAARLTGGSVGGASLRSTGNTVGTITGFTNVGGGFDFVNSGPLAITGTIDGGQALEIAATGIGFAGQTLLATGTVRLNGRTGAVNGGSAAAGSALTIVGGSVNIETATAGSGATGVLEVTSTAGGLRLGTGFAGQQATLRSAGEIAVTTSLTAGTAGNTASVSTLDAQGNGAVSIARATSNNGDVTLAGSSAAVGTATASNGGLLIRALEGTLTLGDGQAGGDATLEAIGTGGDVGLQGALIAGGGATITGTGPVNLGTVSATSATAIRSLAGSIDFATLAGGATKSVTAASAITGGSIAGSGAVTLLAGAATAAANTITIGAIGAAAPVASLTINGGSVVTLGSPGDTINVAGPVAIGQGSAAADLTGALTIEAAVNAGGVAATTTGMIRLADVTSNGPIVLATSRSGDVSFATLRGEGEKLVNAAGAIAGNAIAGRGAVGLNPSAAGAVTIAEAIGSPTAPVAALTVTRGGTVQIGSVSVTGAAAFGQTTPLSSLTLGAASVGSLTATSTGTTRFATIDSPGSLRITTTGGDGDILFSALRGAGDKRLSAGRSIAGVAADGTGGSIDGGAVALIGATADSGGTTTIDALGLNAPLTALAIDGGAEVTIGRTGSSGAAVTVTGAASIGQSAPVGALTVNGTTGASAIVSTSTGATILTGGVTATGGGITLAAGSLQAQTLIAPGSVAVTSTRDAALIGGSAGGDFAIAAGGAARVGGAVAAGGAYRVRGAGVSLGTGATVQSARGLIDIVTTGGTLTGSNGLILTSNADGAGSEYLAIDTTGGIGFDGVALIGGTATNASDVSIVERASGAAVTLGTVTGRQLGSLNAARSAIVPLATTGAVTATGLINVQRGLGITSTGGAITLDEVRITDAGQGITLTTARPAGGGVSARALSANTFGAITIEARGAVQVGTASGGATSLRGARVEAGAVNARGTLGVTANAGAVTLNTADARGATTISATGGDAEVTTRLTAGGATAIGATGAVRLAEVIVSAGDLAVTSGGGVTGVGSGRANLSANGSGANLRVQAGGGAVLGVVQAAGAASVQAGSIDAVRTVATAGPLSLTASSGNVTLGSGTAGSSALIDAAQTATAGAVTAGSGSALTIRALDAALSGSLRAGQVAFVNRAPASNTVKLGNGTSAGGFQLSASEVNLVDAPTLLVDGGTGNVEFGALAFGGNAGRTNVDVLATGRIDVLGAVTGSGNGRTFRLGGTSQSADAKASVIQLVTTASGGGRLLVETANLDLRGSRIGAGQASGFLDPLGFGAGQTAQSSAAVGEAFVGNANSSLYNPAIGGTSFNPPGVTYLSANALTVRYTDYALFQNTAVPGLNAGVVLGSPGAAVTNALVLQGSGVSNANSFALFGTINGITGTPTAVLGPTVISPNNVSLATTRVNGCIVGSGAGCLTSVVSQPILNVFDASRLDVFRTADDLALPFDPVIGTNNEALFSGITLFDVPVTSTNCPDGVDSPQCRQQQLQGEPK